MKSLKVIGTLEGHSEWGRPVAFSPDGAILARGSDDGTIKLWDMKSLKEIGILKGHSEYVWPVAFSPNGSTLASGSHDNTIKLWDVKSLKEVGILKGHSDGVESVAFSPDGSILASGSGDDTIKLWDVKSLKEIGTLEGHSLGVSSVVFSPDGAILASGGGDNTVKLWDVKSRKVIGTLEGHSGGVYSVAFSPDGNILASGSGDGTILLWDVKNFKERAKQSQPETEKALGYIKAVYEKDGKRYLDIDYVQWLTGKEAIKAAIEDKECIVDFEGEDVSKLLKELEEYDISMGFGKFGSCAPNGFYIRNQNPKIRTFEIDPNVSVFMQTLSHASDGNFNWNEQISISKLKDLINGTDRPDYLKPENNPYINPVYDNPYNRIPFHIEIMNGIVKKITEQYLP
jgi:WD40 repeat protein